MGILSWVVFGALVGWVASLIAGTDRRQGCLANIVVGVAGAFIGGFITHLATGRGPRFGFNLPSLIVAVVGAIILLVVTGATRSRR